MGGRSAHRLTADRRRTVAQPETIERAALSSGALTTPTSARSLEANEGPDRLELFGLDARNGGASVFANVSPLAPIAGQLFDGGRSALTPMA